MSFDTAKMSGNSAQCPKCGKMTPSNKENMTVILEDGSQHYPKP